MSSSKNGGKKLKSESEKNVRQCFFDFCKQTILHGWHYLAEWDSNPGSNSNQYSDRGKTAPSSDIFFQKTNYILMSTLINIIII